MKQAEPAGNADQAETIILKPKKRWHQRLGGLFLLFLIALVGAHYMWGRLAGERLAELDAQYRQLGQPVVSADLAEAPVPDDQNVVVSLRAAHAAIDRTTEAWVAFDELDLDEGVDEAQWPIVERALEENGTALDHLRIARRMPLVRWDLDLSSPLMAKAYAEYDWRRGLTGLARAAAMRSHRQSRDRETLGHVQELRKLARAYAQHIGLVGYLISVGCEMEAMDVLLDCAPAMRINDRFDAAIPTSVAKQTITELLDETAPHAALRRGAQTERVCVREMLVEIAHGRMSLNTMPGKRESATALKITGYTLRPMLLGDAVLTSRYMTALADTAAIAPSLPEFRQAEPAMPVAKDGKRRMLHPFTAILTPAMSAIANRHYGLLASRKLGATALAIRMYQEDHDGRLPGALADLVPTYLSAVPDDPFSGRPFIYDASRQTLYSVNVDGQDDGGAVEAGQTRWGMKDIIVNLAPKPGQRKPGDTPRP